MRRHFAFVIAALCVVSVGGASKASTVIDLVGTRGSDPSYVFGVATCSIECYGVLSGSLSNSTAFAQNIGNSSEANEAATLNLLLNSVGTFVQADAVKEDNSNSPFLLSGLYVAIKAGNVTAYLYNSAGVAQVVTYIGNPSGGLSHKTNIGALPITHPDPVPSVPLPAAGLLLLGAVSALGGMRKLRKS